MEKKEERIDEEEEQQVDEIDAEQAIALPNREAMTVLAPPLLSGINAQDPQAPTDPIAPTDGPPTVKADP